MSIIGHIDQVSHETISGWAADTVDLSASVTLIIAVNGVDVGRITAATYREGLKSIAPGATGKYAFRYEFPEHLSPFQTYTVLVRERSGNKILEPGFVELAPSREGKHAPPSHPILPLMLSTICDASAGVLVGLLAAHQSFVVDDDRGEGVGPVAYCAKLHSLMLTAAHPNHDGAALLDDKVGRGLHIRFGNTASFGDFIADGLVDRLSALFSELIADFYNRVAANQEKPFPIHFVERVSRDPAVRGPTLSLLPDAKQMILVRDVRDVLNTVLQSGAADLDAAIDILRSDAALLIEAARGGACVVRYEDLVSDPVATLDQVQAYLGLGVDFEAIDPGGTLEPYARGEIPHLAIGRWREELALKAIERCDVFEPYQRYFGYSAPMGQPLAAAVANATDHELRELMLGFESLGENCEFGLVQRRCGGEPLGLFRFASVPLPKLMAVLNARFEGLAEAGNLRVGLSENGREYMVHDRRFGLLYHAWVLAGEMTVEEIHAREARRLPLLIRKLIEDLELGEKIFVYHGMRPLTGDQASGLAVALEHYGPSALLWVEAADSNHAPGTVERLAPRLLKGYIDRFAPGENAHDLSLDCWIAVCREAVRLHRQAPASASAGVEVAARQRRSARDRARRSTRHG